MSVIYEPRGRALEYSQLATNIYTGCVHQCQYCYAPGSVRKKKETYHLNVQPKKGYLARLKKDCRKMAGDPREILLCFTCDPYQPIENDITHEALLILEKYRMNVQVLTKGGMRAARDFDILQRNGWKFGTTLLFAFDENMRKWEPYPSASILDRVEAISTAHHRGIFTWVSVEPVINPYEALHMIEELMPYVNFWKVGKLNHFPEIERGIDWVKFREDVEKRLKGRSYYIKEDLRKC